MKKISLLPALLLALTACGSGIPDLACNISMQTDAGPADMCVELFCSGDASTCTATIGAQGCDSLEEEFSSSDILATVTTATSCGGSPCHSRYWEGNGVSVTTDFFGVNALGNAVCEAAEAQAD